MESAPTPKSPERAPIKATGRWPIAWHLVMVALAAAAPFVALTAFLAYEVVDHDTRSATEIVQRHAATIADDTDQTVLRVRRVLEGLAQRPLIAALDPTRCDPLLADLITLNPGFTNAFTLDATGRRICSGLPQDATIPTHVDPARYLDAVRARRGFALGGPGKGLTSGKSRVTAAMPILGTTGEVAGVVSIGINIDALIADITTRSPLAPDAVVYVYDAKGTILIRIPDREGWTGTDGLASPIARIALERRKGTVRGAGRLGVERLWAFTPVPSAGWIVLSGIRTEVALASVHGTVATIAALGALSVAFAVLLAIALARPIARPIVGIAAAARRMSAGHSVERLVPRGPAEIASLAVALNELLGLRMMAERDLGESEARLKETQRTAHTGSWRFRADGSVDLSEQMAELFQLPSGGTPTYDMLIAAIHPEDRDISDRRFQEALESSADYFDAEYRVIWRDGQVRTLHSIGTLHRDAQGKLVEGLGTVQDVTERVQAQHRVQQLNAELEHRVKERTAELEAANHDLHAFDYSISHDLRAPVNRMLGFGEALLEGYSDRLGPEGVDLAMRIHASGESMARLITDMLALATISRGDVHRSEIDMSALARNIMESLQRTEPSRTIEIIVAPGCRAEADPGLMRIALQNLLGNAWKFTSKREAARVEFGCLSRAGEAHFFVRDNGAGFDPARAGQLFEPFRRLHSQAEFGGTGIGLATVERIFRRHGGRVWAESAVGEGATFWFTTSRVE